MKLKMSGVTLSGETAQGTVTTEWREAVIETTPQEPKQEGNRAFRRSKKYHALTQGN